MAEHFTRRDYKELLATVAEAQAGCDALTDALVAYIRYLRI
jgi:hypothetical protein